MNRLTKRRLRNLIGTLFFAFLVFIGAYSMFANVTVDLEDLDNFEGSIIDKGVIENSSSISKVGSVSRNIYFIKLDGLDQTLSIYNMSQNYQSIDSRLKIGDTIRVYFRSSTNFSKPNLNLFQIEKAGIILYDNKEFRKREGKGLVVAIIGLIAIIVIGIVQDRRLRLGKAR